MKSETIRYEQLTADALAKNTRWWEIYEECFPLAEETRTPDRHHRKCEEDGVARHFMRTTTQRDNAV